MANEKVATKKTKKIRGAERSIGANLSFGAAEAYKLLRTNLNFSLPDNKGCKVIGITSSLPGEGKSTTAINTAYTMAQTGSRVLLLESDLRLPTLGNRLSVSPTPGLSNLLVGQCAGRDVIQQSNLINNLWVVTAGDIPPNPAELLSSEQMKVTIETMSTVFDVIIIDLPPITAVTDALIISKLVGGVVLVVRQNYCDRASLNDSVRQLKFAGAKVLGMVMTDSDVQSKNYRRRSSYYKREAYD